jgi:lipopolysaccharide/colanic/teichoic acid biosynthesis glycosyltransferase
MDAAVKERLQPEQRPETYVVPAQVHVAGSQGYLFVKRLADVILAFLGLAVLYIPMLIIALVIRLDSTGPALFTQERLGKNGKPFIMIKFRSMRMDAEVNGPQWADKNDCRCTKVGRFLRKSRLDELPQLVNILMGEMSFVGPRPERACFYDEFEQYIPHFRQRLQVQPGLTGHAQVNGGYELKPEEKIVYDLEYIAKRSVKMDLQCIWKTVLVVFSHDGAR